MNKVCEDVRSFVIEVNPKFLTTLKYKFSKQEYLDVASIAFKFWKDKNKIFKWKPGATDKPVFHSPKSYACMSKVASTWRARYQAKRGAANVN